MKKWPLQKYILLVLVLQLVVLASIAGKREWIYAFGERIYLRTAPVDPRDIFRGDYVQLDYEISQPDATLVDKAILASHYQTVYLQLQRDRHGTGQLTGISREKPAGLFIKGFINDRQDWNNNNLVRLGIEKYFIEQGSGTALEERRGSAQEWQTPMEMEVALGSDGTAIIRGYRWSQMGIRLEVLENGRNNDIVSSNQGANAEPAARLSPKLRISIRNQSGEKLRLIDSAEHCAFTLVKNSFEQAHGQTYQTLQTPYRPCDDAAAIQWLTHELKPGQIYTVDIDLTEPQWRILANGKEQQLAELADSWSGFRWIYQLPETERVKHASQGDIWLSTLRTARFNATGRID